ncbi:TPA: chromosomal protein MC1 [archaeon]|uniref:Chromosomal protein MC1 n=1 Tax=Candidatus Naiadarchaeum limnaeum TaxID=2756139 RepID=A0A832V3L2_9ARCH|nr:chromosomal protein MC1 [Candidatus Naiadarchaeales archaeon SRR2090153.bin1042]HIK00372.1 chromosomal protein MC1 [Candidatus Naiadarchaeum limnaeum]
MVKKFYIIRSGKNPKNSKDTEHVFTGASPRQAALKAAKRGYTNFMFRERGRRNSDGTVTIHVFKGSWKLVKYPRENKPSWLPDKIRMPVVKKVQTARVEEI